MPRHELLGQEFALTLIYCLEINNVKIRIPQILVSFQRNGELYGPKAYGKSDSVIAQSKILVSALYSRYQLNFSSVFLCFSLVTINWQTLHDSGIVRHDYETKRALLIGLCGQCIAAIAGSNHLVLNYLCSFFMEPFLNLLSILSYSGAVFNILSCERPLA